MTKDDRRRMVRSSRGARPPVPARAALLTFVAVLAPGCLEEPVIEESPWVSSSGLGDAARRPGISIVEPGDAGSGEAAADAMSEAGAEAVVDVGEEGDGAEPVDAVPALACEELVPPPIDALRGTGDFLPGLDDGHFCARGSVTYTIAEVPAVEIARILSTPETEDRYYLAFGLANSSNRNWAASQVKRRTPTSDAEIIVKTGGGSCIECEACCQCALGPLGDVFCGSEIARSVSPAYAAGASYTIRWDSEAHELCFRRGSRAEVCSRFEIPMPFAFNRYCGGAACDMIHWTAGRHWWTAASVTFESFTCEQVVTEVPPSCE
jgi:hypothetical protein